MATGPVNGSDDAVYPWLISHPFPNGIKPSVCISIDLYENATAYAMRQWKRWEMTEHRCNCSYPTPDRIRPITDPPLLVTVDVEGIVEEEDDFRSVERLASLLETLSIPVTLFVTPTVAINRPETVAGWVDAGHAVGLHVHPARLGGDSDWLATYDKSDIKTFLGRGQDALRDHVGLEPVLFRAGRWSHSRTLLAALDEQGIESDASQRSASRRSMYRYRGVTEYPMTVFENSILRYVLRPYGIDGLPLHPDAFLGSYALALSLYAATIREVLSDRSYVMVSFHDYDLVDEVLRRRVTRYLTRVTDWYRSDRIKTLPIERNP